MTMTVAKFGGTSIGSADSMRAASTIVCGDSNIRLVVLSAVSGTTNDLVELIRFRPDSDLKNIDCSFHELKERHNQIISELDLEDNLLEDNLQNLVEDWAIETRKLLRNLQTTRENPKQQRLAAAASDLLLSQGEKISTAIFTALLNKSGTHAAFVDAQKIIRTDDNFGRAEPEPRLIRQLAREHLPLFSGSDRFVYVTQGFVGATANGETTTLGRGGSDFSAALFAEATDASELQIWTDVAGIRTIDPRIDIDAKVISKITFPEAAEMANFGAKILHPATLEPARRAKVRVFIGDTRSPNSDGTTICPELAESPAIRAVAIRKNQTLITVSSPRMLNTHGFLAKMFAILAEHRISVDLVTTSEVSVALTIDSASLSSEGKQITEYSELLRDLHSLGEVRIEGSLALIALIGNNLQNTPGISAHTFTAIGSTNVRLICQGASSHNLCFLVDASEAEHSACALHQSFILKTGTADEHCAQITKQLSAEAIPLEVQ